MRFGEVSECARPVPASCLSENSLIDAVHLQLWFVWFFSTLSRKSIVLQFVGYEHASSPLCAVQVRLFYVTCLEHEVGVMEVYNIYKAQR